MFKLTIVPNKMTNIAQKDALEDINPIEATNNRNTIPAMDPIFTIEQ